MGTESVDEQYTAETASWSSYFPVWPTGTAECPDAEITSRLSEKDRRLFHAREGGECFEER